MKKLLFSLFAALAFTACQNNESPSANGISNTATPQDAAAPQPAARALPEPAKVAVDVQASLDEIKKISAQIDALPDNVKRTKSEQVNELRNMVESLTEKQTKLIQELNAPAQPAQPGGSDATSIASAAGGSKGAAVEEAVQSIARYQKDIENMKEQLKALSGKQ